MVIFSYDGKYEEVGGLSRRPRVQEDITLHLQKRICERMGIPKRAHKRLYEIFQTRGKTMEEVKESGNEPLYRYLCSVKKDDSELRVFGNHVMISTLDGIGITIINIPNLHTKSRSRKDDNDGIGRCTKIKKQVRSYNKEGPIDRRNYWTAKERLKWKRALRNKKSTNGSTLGQ